MWWHELAGRQDCSAYELPVQLLGQVQRGRGLRDVAARVKGAWWVWGGGMQARV